MKKQIEHIKKYFKIYRMTIIVFMFLTIFLFGFNEATEWCIYQNFFSLDTAVIHGNNLVADSHIIKTGNIHKKMDILSTDCSAIRNNLETHPYVKAAIVSKRYPNKMEIFIKERTPIAYLNAGKLFLIDQEGVVLPIPESVITNQLPVITISSDTSYNAIAGEKLNTLEIKNITQLVIDTYSLSRPLFNTISEIQYEVSSGELIVYNKDSANPIYFGKDEFNKKMIILSKFQRKLTNKKRLSDYKYIDLRFNQQIIVREI